MSAPEAMASHAGRAVAPRATRSAPAVPVARQRNAVVRAPASTIANGIADDMTVLEESDVHKKTLYLEWAGTLEDLQHNGAAQYRVDVSSTWQPEDGVERPLDKAILLGAKMTYKMNQLPVSVGLQISNMAGHIHGANGTRFASIFHPYTSSQVDETFPIAAVDVMKHIQHAKRYRDVSSEGVRRTLYVEPPAVGDYDDGEPVGKEYSVPMDSVIMKILSDNQERIGVNLAEFAPNAKGYYTVDESTVNRVLSAMDEQVFNRIKFVDPRSLVFSLARADGRKWTDPAGFPSRGNFTDKEFAITAEVQISYFLPAATEAKSKPKARSQ